jgi:hypothetical protein
VNVNSGGRTTNIPMTTGDCGVTVTVAGLPIGYDLGYCRGRSLVSSRSRACHTASGIYTTRPTSWMWRTAARLAKM